MRHVDLERYRFDCDLTFAALLMNADGTVYHRYGGRDWKDAESALSIPSLLAVLRGTLEEHAAYAKSPAPPALPPPRTLEKSESFARRDAEKRVDCVHCHTVGDFTYKDAVA